VVQNRLYKPTVGPGFAGAAGELAVKDHLIDGEAEVRTLGVSQRRQLSGQQVLEGEVGSAHRPWPSCRRG